MLTGRRLVVVFVGPAARDDPEHDRRHDRRHRAAEDRLATSVGCRRSRGSSPRTSSRRWRRSPLMGKLGDLYGRRRLFLSAIIVVHVGLDAVRRRPVDRPADRVPRSCRASARAGSARWRWRSSPTSSRPGSSAAGSATRARSSRCRSIVGPLAGGIFVDQLSWRWAFYVNVPIAAASVSSSSASTLHLPYRRHPARDRLRAAPRLLTGGLICLVVARRRGGGEPGVDVAGDRRLCAGRVALGALFVWRQRRAPEPIVPLRLFADPWCGSCTPSTSPAGSCCSAASSSCPCSSRRSRA